MYKAPCICHGRTVGQERKFGLVQTGEDQDWSSRTPNLNRGDTVKGYDTPEASGKDNAH